MKFAGDFRREAREALQNNWGKAVGTGLIASLLGAGIEGCSGGSSNVEFDSETLERLKYSIEDPEAIAILLGIAGFAMITALIMSLVYLFIGSPVTLGYCKFNLNLVDQNGKAAFADLFSEFKHFGPAVALQLLRGIYTFLWSLLFVIPGIIKTYSYSMAAYILQEHPEMTPNDAITKSRELMDGNKWRLFCLHFSFIGWSFLCVFTCGIGYLWLFPYEQTAVAAFYREIWREAYGEPVVAEGPAAAETSYEQMIEDRYRETTYRDEN
jgi:uncharacterized membrane protein